MSDEPMNLRLNQHQTAVERIRHMAGRIGVGYVYWNKVREFMAAADLSEHDIEEILRSAELESSREIWSVMRYRVRGQDADDRSFSILLTLDDEGSRLEIIQVNYAGVG